MIFYRGHSISAEFAGIGKPDKFMVRRIAANGVTAVSIKGPFATAADARTAIDAALAPAPPITADTLTERHIEVIRKEAGRDIDLSMSCDEAYFDPATTKYPAHRQHARERIAKVWNYRYGTRTADEQELVLAMRGGRS